MKALKKVHAFAPATVANVCCGFDILGFAVNHPGDEVILTRRSDNNVVVKKIEGDNGRLPMETGRNTAGVAIQSMLQRLNLKVGVDIYLKKNLPLGSGMGSSASSGAAALIGFNHLLGNPLTREQLIEHAMEAERVACGSAHADNVAPSILGGFVLVRDYNPLDIIKIPATASLFCTLVHPHLELNTSDSRKVLKPIVSLKDSITQSGNVAGLMLGLTIPDYSLIGRSLKDVIAEPTRSVFIPGFDRMRAITLEAGALGFGISGSGPTVFVISTTKEVADRCGDLINNQFKEFNLQSDTYVSQINQQGAYIISSE